MTTILNLTQALVISLREGIEAALIVAILLAYLKRNQLTQFNRHVYLGIALAAAASVATALLFLRYGLDPENELLEGIMMFTASGMVASLVVWMWRVGRRLKGQVEERLTRIASNAPGARRGLGLFVFTFFMVFREGVETVLFLSALSFTVGSNPMNNYVGGTIGILLAAAFGLLLVRGSLQVNLRAFFSATGIILLILSLRLLAGGIHEFSEIGLLPTSRPELAIVGFLTRESISAFILAALIALPGIIMLFSKSPGVEMGRTEEYGPAERRKIRARARRSRRIGLATAVGSLGLALLLVGAAIATASRGYDPDAIPLPENNGKVQVPLADLADGRIHKYSVIITGTDVRFFLIRGSGGQLASAFDVCYVCPLKGYRQEKDQVICNNCDAPIPFETIGSPGGCNPVTLKASVVGDEVVVKTSDLAAELGRFVTD